MEGHLSCHCADPEVAQPMIWKLYYRLYRLNQKCHSSRHKPDFFSHFFRRTLAYKHIYTAEIELCVGMGLVAGSGGYRKAHCCARVLKHILSCPSSNGTPEGERRRSQHLLHSVLETDKRNAVVLWNAQYERRLYRLCRRMLGTGCVKPRTSQVNILFACRNVPWNYHYLCLCSFLFPLIN